MKFVGGRGVMSHRIYNEDTDDLTTIRRTSKVVWALAHGESLNRQRVRQMTGLTRQGVEYLMSAISNAIPIYYDGDDGCWQVLVLRDLK